MSKRLTQTEVEERVSSTFFENVIVISDYINRRSDLKLQCLDCGHEWKTTAQNVLYTANNSSIHHCPNCGLKDGEYFNCGYCGKQIYRTQKDIDKNISGFFYCSKECGNKHKNQLREERGEWAVSPNNYRSRALKTYLNQCMCCGWDEDPRILEAHHIDEDRTHNEIENLCLLCPTCHRKITLGYYKLDLENKVLIPV